MQSRSQYLLVILSVLIGLFGNPTSSAFAASSPASPGISVYPSSGEAGSTVNISGAGFEPGGYEGTIIWDGVDQFTFFIPEGGKLSVDFTIPFEAAPGKHLITICAACGDGDVEQTATASFEVIASTQPPAPPVEPPSIEYFYSDIDSLPQGACTTVYWKVNNTDNVTLNSGSGTERVKAIDSRQVCPAQTIEYILNAQGNPGADPAFASEHVVITVTTAAIITTPTETATLKPTVLGSTLTPSPTTTPTLVAITPPPPRILPTRRPSPTADMWVCGMEVTQGIQIYDFGSPLDNTIPLVGNKKTVVRVYLQSNPARGLPWTDATARLTVTGGGASGRVHLPMTANSSASIQPSSTACPRNDLSLSFQFLLDWDETQPGNRDLSVTIYSVSGRREADTTNNTMSLHIQFGPRRSAMLYAFAHGVCDAAGNVLYAPPSWSLIEPQRKFTENIYPLSTFFIYPLPGNPTPCFSAIPGGWRADQRANIWGLTAIDLLCPEGGCNIFTFNPNFPEHPQAGWCCGVTSIGNILLNGDTRFGPGSEGRIMGQEFGHKFLGNPHSFSPEYGYPYANNKIGNQYGLRTNAGTYGLGLELRIPNANGDVMSYENNPIWISPYTYCKLLDSMSGGSVVCPPGTNTASISGSHPRALRNAQSIENKYISIMGGVTADERVLLEPFFVMPSPTRQEVVPKNQKGDVYQLMALDVNGNTLSENSFDTIHGTHEQPGDTHMFSLYLPYDPAITTIRLYHNSKLLAARSTSTHAPSIAFTSIPPQGAAGKQTISWNGGDPDGDALTYRLEYSTNNGESWLPLESMTQHTSLDVDFDSLPGADRAALRLLATDGFNTTPITSTSFSVPRKTPQLTLISPLEGASSYEGQPFYAEAYGFDWEDGPISDPSAYQWSSDKDGALPPGMWIVPDSLSAGEHTLTVTAHDLDGNVVSASTHITILKSQPGKYDAPRGFQNFLSIALLIVVVIMLVLAGIILLIVFIRRKRKRSSS